MGPPSAQLGIFCFALAVTSATTQAATSFGQVIIFMTFWRLFLPLINEAEWGTNMMYASLVVSNGFFPVFWPLTIRSLKFCCWEYVIIIFPPSLFMVPVGQHLLLTLPTKFIGLLLGIVVLIAAVFKAMHEMWVEVQKRRNARAKRRSTSIEMAEKTDEAPDSSFLKADGEALDIDDATLTEVESPDEETGPATKSPPPPASLSRRTLALLRSRMGVVLLVVGVTSGLINGLFGMAGIPLMIFWAFSKKLDPQIMRATTLILLATGGSLTRFVALNINPGPNFELLWPLYGAVMAGGQMGLMIGELIHPHLNERAARMAILILLICSGTSLVVKNV